MSLNYNLNVYVWQNNRQDKIFFTISSEALLAGRGKYLPEPCD